MSALDLTRAMEVPGRWAFGCTNLTTAFPHGGTELGLLQEIEVTEEVPIRFVTAEEYGGEIVEGIAGGQVLAMTAVLRAPDDDALNLWMLNTAAGSVTQHKVVEIPGTNRAGYLWSARTTVLVFTPESVIGGNDDQHQMVVFYKAMPHQQRTTRLQMRLRKKWGLAVAAVALRNSSGIAGRIGYRKDLSI